MEVARGKDSIFSDPEYGSILGEARYLLENWNLSMSSTGLLWIESRLERISAEQLAGLLTLLARQGASSLPNSIKIDFSRSRLAGEQWTMVESILIDFAERNGLNLRFVRGSSPPVSAAILLRCCENDVA